MAEAMGTLVVAERVGGLVLVAVHELVRHIVAAMRAVRDFPAQAEQMEQRCRDIDHQVQHIRTTPSLSAIADAVQPQMGRLRNVFVKVRTFLSKLAAKQPLRQAMRYQKYERRFAELHAELDRAWQDLSNAISIRHSLALGDPKQQLEPDQQRLLAAAWPPPPPPQNRPFSIASTSRSLWTGITKTLWKS
jgi:hypothetical protein